MSRARPGELMRFMERAAKFNGNECLIWPFWTTGPGYPGATVGGKKTRATRWVLELVSGPPPFEGAEAAHKCNVRLCVNPSHLYWATHQQNMDDQLKHGTRLVGGSCSWAKLTDDDAACIKNDDRPLHLIASQYGVSSATVSRIKSGKTWRHIT